MSDLYTEMFDSPDEVDDVGRQREQVEFDDCEGLRETEKAVLVRFKHGKERWVPKGQIEPDSEVYGAGHKGTLVVNDWIAERWAEEKHTEKDAPVAVEGVVVVRETEKAVMIEKVGDEDTPGIWIPKGQIHSDSLVKGDGDTGTILLSAWIAEQKGLKGAPQKKIQRAAARAVQKPLPTTRRGKPDGADGEPDEDGDLGPGPGEGDLPF